MGAETYHQLKRDAASSAAWRPGVGDEGGFAPALDSNEAPLELLVAAIEAAGYRPGDDIAIAWTPPPASSSQTARYDLAGEGRSLSPTRWSSYWAAARRPLPDRARSRTAWPRTTGTAGGKLTERLGDRVQLVGDDIFVTNPAILRDGIERGHRQLDPDQAQPDRHAHRDPRRDRASRRDAGYRAVISHRSGETEDTFIADLAVATGAGQIKTGAPARSERVAKYNQLLRIEEELGEPRALRRPRRRRYVTTRASWVGPVRTTDGQPLPARAGATLASRPRSVRLGGGAHRGGHERRADDHEAEGKEPAGDSDGAGADRIVLPAGPPWGRLHN